MLVGKLSLAARQACIFAASEDVCLLDYGGEYARSLVAFGSAYHVLKKLKLSNTQTLPVDGVFLDFSELSFLLWCCLSLLTSMSACFARNQSYKWYLVTLLQTASMGFSSFSVTEGSAGAEVLFPSCVAVGSPTSVQERQRMNHRAACGGMSKTLYTT